MFGKKLEILNEASVIPLGLCCSKMLCTIQINADDILVGLLGCLKVHSSRPYRHGGAPLAKYPLQSGC